MIPLNYHHLYYFWVTAKSGSISSARKQLLLAQPTLSLQIAELEEFFGKKLLHRSRKGVTLTPEGKIAFEYCEAIFRQGDALAGALRSGRGSRPALSIGVGKSVSREIVLKILDEIQEVEKDIQTVVINGSPAELEERLARHTLDVAISDRPLAGSAEGLRSRRAAAIAVFFVAAPALKNTLRQFPRSGQSLPMLLRPADNLTRQEVDRYLREHRLKATVAAEVEDPDLIRILALQGKGVAALNSLAIRQDLSAGRLTRLGTRPTGINEDVWLLASAYPHPDARLSRVVDHLMTRFAIKSSANN